MTQVRFNRAPGYGPPPPIAALPSVPRVDEFVVLDGRTHRILSVVWFPGEAVAAQINLDANAPLERDEGD
jgi:hypothetical protein